MSGGCRGRKAPFEGPHPAEAKASEPVMIGGPQTGRSSGGARPYLVAAPVSNVSLPSGRTEQIG